MLGKQIFYIAQVEFTRLRRSWIFWIGLVLINGILLLIDSTIQDGHLWIGSSSAYNYAHGVSILGSFFVPVLMIALYYFDQTSKISMVLFSQPITSKVYALGKFFGGCFAYLGIVGIGMVVFIFTPLYFGAYPYSPYVFLKALLVYTLPSMFFYLAFCYLLVVIFQRPLLSFLIPVMYVILSDPLPSLYQFLLRDEKLATLANGISLPIELQKELLYNRLIFIGLGILMLLVAIIFFNPKRYLESR